MAHLSAGSACRPWAQPSRRGAAWSPRAIYGGGRGRYGRDSRLPQTYHSRPRESAYLRREGRVSGGEHSDQNPTRAQRKTDPDGPGLRLRLMRTSSRTRTTTLLTLNLRGRNSRIDDSDELVLAARVREPRRVERARSLWTAVRRPWTSAHRLAETTDPTGVRGPRATDRGIRAGLRRMPPRKKRTPQAGRAGPTRSKSSASAALSTAAPPASPEPPLQVDAAKLQVS